MKTCKKLFSLLLVAVMLVAAIPFAAMADTVNVTGVVHVTVTGAINSTFDYGTTENAPGLTDFDVTNKTHLTNVLVYGNCADFKPEHMEVVSGTLVGNDLTINVKNFYTVKITGDATATGSNKLDSVAHANYGELANTLTAAGLSEYLDSTKWTIKTPIAVTDFVMTVPVEKVAATTTPTNPTPTTPTPTNPTPTAPSETTYTTVTVNIDGKLYDSYSVNYKKAGELQKSDASAILATTGKSFDLTKYSVKNVVANGTAITVDLETIPYAGWTLKVTDGSTTKTYTKDSYTGSLTNVSEIMTAFGATKDFTIANYETASVANDGKNFTVTLVTKPTANDIYTVNVAINGNQYASKSNVTYRGTFGSNATDAQAILSAAKIDGVTASNYEKITVTKSSNNVISIDLRNVVTIKVYNNASTFTNTAMEIGRPYVNYLGTNIINNSTFGGITVKDNSGASRFYTASQVTGGTAVVNANDVEVTIQRNGDSCTLNFLRSDGTVLESRKLYAGDQIGTLPSYTVGGVPATWTYNGKPISATDVYNFKTTSVNIVPYFGGISDVYVDVYINGNVKTMQTRVKVTDLVQNGVLYLNTDVKGAIASALRNSSNKNLTYTAFFDASTWSDFIKTKNTSGAAEPYRVGDNSERQGAVYLYVMVNNATVKATDSTNPKTGDNVKLGAAAAILAVAVVGFGAVVVINKKKGVR